MMENNNNLFLSYLALESTATPGEQEVLERVREMFGSPPHTHAKEIPAVADDSIQEELHASRRYYTFQEYLKIGQRYKEAERKNVEYAKEHGLLRECECCFVNFPLNRMVSCSGEPHHLFCKQCPRKQAEEMVGQSRYRITCLSLGGSCSAPFSLTERAKFLDKGLTTALERIEQDAELRAANIEGLVQCPFCSFAAICVSEEENREFPCQNPDCLVVSCRLCRGESHVPISCEEALQKTGFSARREIEEAMSSALIRKCNKCSTPFIKTLGCNKVSCTRCGNIQCDVCSKNCDYTHFKENQPKTEAGAKGCPLYDNTEHRYAREVDAAEKETRRRLVKEHPGIDAQYLEIPRPPPPTPAPNKRRRAPILRMFEQNAMRARPRDLPPGALQNMAEDAPQVGAQDGAQNGHGGSQDGSQEDSQEDFQEDSQDDSQDGYDYDSEVDSLEAEQDDSGDESSDEGENPNKRQKREPNEEVVVARIPAIPRAPRPHLAVPNLVRNPVANLIPGQLANDLTQQRPQFVFPFGGMNAPLLPQWPRGLQQQVNVQQQQQQQQQANVQQQRQANIQQQQQQQCQHHATAQQLLALQQEQIAAPQWIEHMDQAQFQLMRAHHHAQLQAQQLQHMQAQERAQQRHAGAAQQQHHVLMQARRQEQLQMLVRAQAQFHQQGQQRALQTAQLMAQREALQRHEGRAQEQAPQQTLEQIQMQALRQTIQQQVPSSPWEALEQALIHSHHETLRHLSQLDAQQLGLAQYQSGTQQHALAQHQAQGHFPNLQAQQQGPAEHGLGMPPAIAEEGDWGQHHNHGQ
ncbi:hypothetical protein THARTR1_04280 [Trichoderma harzianum]|uniref:RING-type domain-containing protein n=1 Tax=Trichoderma harzianum TaxID=5544 RepID=A0A2K0UCE4_TRIHA|nr:hypothetical protein THARTR1_04280 [Trichoderma harzianum]